MLASPRVASLSAEERALAVSSMTIEMDAGNDVRRARRRWVAPSHITLKGEIASIHSRPAKRRHLEKDAAKRALLNERHRPGGVMTFRAALHARRRRATSHSQLLRALPQRSPGPNLLLEPSHPNVLSNPNGSGVATSVAGPPRASPRLGANYSETYVRSATEEVRSSGPCT